jgi:hypothetical protein
MKINKCHFIFIFLLLFISVAQGQQTASKVEPPRTADMTFNPEIEKPAFAVGQGPVVQIDEAHNNFHTAVGTYLPFAKLLERDGFVITRGKTKISPESLRTCRIYVISDAQPPSKKGDPPTFSQDEIEILTDWVKRGGSLFLITDHMPDPAAIEKLASSFGIEVNNGYVLNNHFSEAETPMVFERSDNSLANHPITNGRNHSETVQSVATFTGSAFKTDSGFLPILILKPDKRYWMPKKLYDFRADTPYVNVSGWFQGAVSNFGQGKIAIFSEAAMFTAQIFDLGKIHVGMNHPLAEDNAQLLLNVLHWLSDLL